MLLEIQHTAGMNHLAIVFPIAVRDLMGKQIVIRFSYHQVGRSIDQGQELLADFQVAALKVFHKDDGLAMGQEGAQPDGEIVSAATGAPSATATQSTPSARSRRSK